VRMAALMKKRVIFVYTHDSIGLGEDGPTHQSVEHTASLRLIPHLDVWRPADTVETMVAWRSAVERHNGPSALVLTRQNCAFVVRDPQAIDDVKRGGYVLQEPFKGKAVIALIATGSEIGMAVSAAAELAKAGIAARVVSIPCTSVFDRQDVTYKRHVLPDNLPRVAVEAGVTDGWWKYRCNAVLGVDRFGESAPGPKVYEALGMTVANLVSISKQVLGK
jgi:transketolase